MGDSLVSRLPRIPLVFRVMTGLLRRIWRTLFYCFCSIFMKASLLNILAKYSDNGRKMILLISVTVRIAAWLLLSLITILSLVPPHYRPETSLPHNLEHFAIFAATGLCFGIGYRHRSTAVVIGLVTFAGTIELAQKLVHGRHARLSDFIIDAVAMSVSTAVGSFFANRYLLRNVGHGTERRRNGRLHT